MAHFAYLYLKLKINRRVAPSDAATKFRSELCLAFRNLDLAQGNSI